MTKLRKTEREALILRLLGQGWSPRRVGKKFGLSETRVRYVRERAAYERVHPFFTVR